MQLSPAERIFSPLLEHLTHLLRAHGAMLCSTIYTTHQSQVQVPPSHEYSGDNHYETNVVDDAIEEPQEGSLLNHQQQHRQQHDLITSLALISHQSLVSGCGVLGSGEGINYELLITIL